MAVLGNLFARFTRGTDAACAASVPPVEAAACLDEIVNGLLAEERVIVFKHSTSCPVSWAAHSQVTRFLKENPDAPLRIVNVIKERPLSQKIAAVTGVRHESPQILLLERGEVTSEASHGEITLDYLKELVPSASGTK